MKKILGAILTAIPLMVYIYCIFYTYTLERIATVIAGMIIVTIMAITLLTGVKLLTD